MANVKITALQHIPTLAAADVFVIDDVSTLTTHKVSIANVAGYVGSSVVAPAIDSILSGNVLFSNSITVANAVIANAFVIGNYGTVINNSGQWIGDPSGLVGFVGSQGNIGFTGSQGSPGITQWIRVTTNYTAVSQNGIIADTSAGSFTVTLPASPVVGSYVVIADGSNFQTVNLIVARNGSTIEGISEDLVLDVGNIRVDLVYDGTTWEVFASVGQTGFVGSQGFTGSQGDIGFTGSQGAGFTGSKGDIGFVGSQGDVGFVGSKGDSTEVTVTDDTTTNATRYLTFVNNASGTANNIGVSSTKLYFNPSSGRLNSTEFNSLSDIKFKTDIKILGDALTTINNLNGVEFVWKDSGTKSFGVIAQEVEKVIPEIVSIDADKTVNYNSLIAFIIEAIKELDRKINDKYK